MEVARAAEQLRTGDRPARRRGTAGVRQVCSAWGPAERGIYMPQSRTSGTRAMFWRVPAGRLEARRGSFCAPITNRRRVTSRTFARGVR